VSIVVTCASLHVDHTVVLLLMNKLILNSYSYL